MRIVRLVLTWRFGASAAAIIAGLWIAWIAAGPYITIFSNPEYTALVSDSGKLLCIDRNIGDHMVANRDMAGLWERFIIKPDKDGSCRIKTTFGFYLAGDTHGMVRAVKDKKPATQLFIEDTGGKVRIRDAKGNYWRVADDLSVQMGPENAASAFTPVHFRAPVPQRQYYLLFISVVLILASCIMIQLPRSEKLAIWPLLGATVSLMIFCIAFFDFIFIWDEQYHLLVAKNMIQDPFRPMLLKNQLLPIDPKNWITGHIWLHKQPLFMWQMALSMRFFGITEWAARIPDLVMVTAMTAAVYRTGKLLADIKTGFFAALFLSVSHFIFLLASGAQFTDHNDMIFAAYATLSIWAWIEYEHGPDKKSRIAFLLLAGAFAGCAVLVKWLPGLIVFAGWGVVILLEEKRRTRVRSYTDLLLGLLACAVVVLPWQIYTLIVFPQEALHEFAYAAEHYTKALDGHTGDGLGWRYHFVQMLYVYKVGWITWLLMLPLFFTVLPRKKIASALLFMVVIVYVFFTFGETKMPGYTFFVCAVFFLVLAANFRFAESFLQMILPVRFPKVLLVTAALFWLSTYFIDPYTTMMVFYPPKFETGNPVNRRSALASLYRDFDKVVPKEEQARTVVMNCPLEDCPPMMFYTDLKAVYPFHDEGTYQKLKETGGIRILYMDMGDAGIPGYIANDSAVMKVFVPDLLENYFR